MTRRDALPPVVGAPARGVTEVQLRVDPVTCDGIGLCAHLAPRLIELDRWGYPVIAAGALTTREVGEARAAVRACPRRALWLERTTAAR